LTVKVNTKCVLTQGTSGNASDLADDVGLWGRGNTAGSWGETWRDLHLKKFRAYG